MKKVKKEFEHVKEGCRLSIYVDAETKRELEAWAKWERKSLSHLLRDIIHDWKGSK